VIEASEHHPFWSFIFFSYVSYMLLYIYLGHEPFWLLFLLKGIVHPKIQIYSPSCCCSKPVAYDEGRNHMLVFPLAIHFKISFVFNRTKKLV